MKKIITIIGIILIFSFRKDQPQLLKVEADIKQWNDIISIIDLSAADPQSRVNAKNFIINQLNQQLKPLPKSPTDSIKQKK